MTDSAARPATFKRLSAALCARETSIPKRPIRCPTGCMPAGSIRPSRRREQPPLPAPPRAASSSAVMAGRVLQRRARAESHPSRRIAEPEFIEARHASPLRAPEHVTCPSHPRPRCRTRRGCAGHAPWASFAGLTRASIFFARKFLRRSMDCRVKPGNDDLNLAPMGTSPRMTEEKLPSCTDVQELMFRSSRNDFVSCAISFLETAITPGYLQIHLQLRYFPLDFG